MTTPNSYVTIVVSDPNGTLANESPDASTRLFLSPSIDGNVVLYPEITPEAPGNGDRIAAHISRRYGSALLAEVGAGDETFRLRLFDAGEPVDEYVAEPGYWSGIETPPTGGDAHRLCIAYAIDDPDTTAELDAVLRAGRYDDDRGFVGASERHRDIVDLLGLPVSSVAVGYDELQRGIVPESVESSAQLRHYETDPAQAIRIRQYAIVAVSPDVTDAAIAARFSPDVISFEEEFEDVDPFRPLGVPTDLRQRFEGIGWPDLATGHIAGSDALTYVLLYLEESAGAHAARERLQRLLNDNRWTAYEYGTMRILRPE